MGQVRRQISAVIAIAAGAALFTALSTTKAGANDPAQVTDVRVGKHKDKKLCDVPISYLTWYKENGDNEKLLKKIDQFFDSK